MSVRPRSHQQPTDDLLSFLIDDPVRRTLGWELAGLAEEYENATDAQQRELSAEIDELLSWLEKPTSSISPAEKLAKIEQLIAQYRRRPKMALRLISKTVRSSGRPRGRGFAETRLLAVAALDEKLRNPRLSWNIIARKHCKRCNKQKIDKLAQSIRNAATRLKKVLRERGFDYGSYEALVKGNRNLKAA